MERPKYRQGVKGNMLLSNELTHSFSVGNGQAQYINEQLQAITYNILRQWLTQNPPTSYQVSLLNEILGTTNLESQDWSNRSLAVLLAAAKFLGIPAFELTVRVFR